MMSELSVPPMFPFPPLPLPFLSSRVEVTNGVIHHVERLNATTGDLSIRTSRIYDAVKQFAYIGEKNTDTWKSPDQTLEDRAGDCEDTSILIASLLTAAGIPNEILSLHILGHSPGDLHAIAGARTEKGLLLLDASLGRRGEIDSLPYGDQAVVLMVEKSLLRGFYLPFITGGIPLNVYRNFPL